MDREKIEAINRYIAVVNVLVMHLEDVIGSLDDEEYIEEGLKGDMKYAEKRINIVNERREELLEIFNEKNKINKNFYERQIKRLEKRLEDSYSDDSNKTEHYFMDKGFIQGVLCAYKNILDELEVMPREEK